MVGGLSTAEFTSKKALAIPLGVAPVLKAFALTVAVCGRKKGVV